MTRRSFRRPWPVLLAGAALALAACGQDDKPAPATGSSTTAAPAAAPVGAPPAGGGDAARGRQVWMANCVACHNPDPSKDGSLGPAVKGASPVLLEARVLNAAYPPGYTPKRPTKIMPPRPDLAGALGDLAAYLR